MEYINDELKKIYEEMYQSLDGTPDDKFEKIQEFCMEDADRWDLSEDEWGDISEAYANKLYDHLKSKFDDFEKDEEYEFKVNLGGTIYGFPNEESKNDFIKNLSNEDKKLKVKVLKIILNISQIFINII